MPADSTPVDPREESWDVIVVGTGMGGATLGYALARRGKKVLFLEKGLDLFGSHDRGDGSMPSDEPEDAEERLRSGRWPLRLEGDTSFGAMKFFGAIGCGTGGSSSIYAAQLERLMPHDLEPRRHFAKYKDTSLPERWPITYDELVPYYRQAEALYRVCGSPDPLNPDPKSPILEPPPMSDRDASLFAAFQQLGLHPYRAHLGCRFLSKDCGGCAGVLCPRGCKSDSGNICLLPAVEQHGARVITEAEVLRLEANGSRVERVIYRHRGEERWVRGKVVAVAAGALMTPVLFLRSQSDVWPNGLSNRTGLVGRNLMMHTSDYYAIRPSRYHSPEGPYKGISLNDLYLKDGVKMGTLQSAGMAVNAGIINYYLKTLAEKLWYMRIGKVARKLASYAGAAIFNRSAVMVSIVEDLPYHDNRVVLDSNSLDGRRFIYTYPRELAERNEQFYRHLRQLLAPKLMVLPIFFGKNNLNFGHVSGTCRGGDDPATSVVNRDNRSHDVENLYVADSSAFPSSGGINPSLTIAARALQVADAIDAAL
ncbi:MAG: GMC family oxidoreductase [Polyangiaceae bacterium]|nr:GMC family oxidoreductase [Polyangiaceae bacterium]